MTGQRTSTMSSIGHFILALLVLALFIKIWYIMIPVAIFVAWYRFRGPGKAKAAATRTETGTGGPP